MQVLARKELNYGRMDERDLRQLTEEVYDSTRGAMPRFVLKQRSPTQQYTRTAWVE